MALVCAIYCIASQSCDDLLLSAGYYP